MRTVAVISMTLFFGLIACEEGEPVECDNEAYGTCADEYNDCAAGEGQCYLNGGVDQACLDGCFVDYCLCLDDFNCDLEGSNCESSL